MYSKYYTYTVLYRDYAHPHFRVKVPEIRSQTAFEIKKITGYNSVFDLRQKGSAPCEARTHDLQIMRLTLCRLSQGGTHWHRLIYLENTPIRK